MNICIRKLSIQESAKRRKRKIRSNIRTLLRCILASLLSKSNRLRAKTMPRPVRRRTFKTGIKAVMKSLKNSMEFFSFFKTRTMKNSFFLCHLLVIHHPIYISNTNLKGMILKKQILSYMCMRVHISHES